MATQFTDVIALLKVDSPQGRLARSKSDGLPVAKTLAVNLIAA